MGFLDRRIKYTREQVKELVVDFLEEATNVGVEKLEKWWGKDKESQVAEKTRVATKDIVVDDSPRIFNIDSTGAELQKVLRIGPELMEMYRDVEEMDDYPESSTVLNLYASNSTIPNSITGKTIWVESKEELAEKVLMDLLHRRLRIEEDIYMIDRTLGKYGNCFCENIVTENGLIGLNFLDVPTVRRVEDAKGSLVGFLQDPTGKFNLDPEKLKKVVNSSNPRKDDIEGCVFFAPWEVTHWRLRSKQIRSQYGSSVLDSARWIWKRLLLLEDTALVYKLTRSPGRFVYYVDVGDLPEKQAMAFLNKVKSAYRKKKLINPGTGQIDFRHNPLSQNEDLWLPTRGGQESTRVEVLAGPDSTMMDDIDYFRSKFFAAVEVPKRYLGAEGETLDRTAAQDDVQFGRAAMRLQRAVIQGFRHICRVHLASLNIDPDRIEYEIKMTVPSYVYELAQLEVLNARADAANNLMNFKTKEWILEHIFRLSKDEAEESIKKKSDQDEKEFINQAKIQARIDREYPGVEIPPEQNIGGEPEIPVESSIEDRVDRLDKSYRSIVVQGNKIARRLDEISPVIKKIYNEGRGRKIVPMVDKKAIGQINEMASFIREAKNRSKAKQAKQTNG